MATILTNIKGLVGVREIKHVLRGPALADLPIIQDAYLIIEGSYIAAYGEMKNLAYKPDAFAFHFDATNKFVLPSWCDSHTHLVYAGSREQEFVAKLKGATYAEIAANGGGILASAKQVHDTSEDELFKQSYARLEEVIKLGTGAIEIKSGYGLSVDGELKMLRVIKRLKAATGATIKATFLGAHAIPPAYTNNREGYIQLIIEKMLPAIHNEKLADFIDVFCDQHFFSPDETERICKAGISYGLKPKLHANQLSVSGGVQTGVKVNALSVDHLEAMDNAAIKALANSETIGTLLPTAAFFLRMPFPPARDLLNANAAIALASDYNPGSSPSGNMNFVLALACIQMKLLPEEAINAATINGAFAMQAADELGSITIGKKANLLITKDIPSIQYLLYTFAHSQLERVMLAGAWVI
ncbi:MAG TPA: imidazolonepropionase [Chitinophagaceae bacterium]|nr:imidazolonepropionase [Chitinophagaceae bacterium]